MPRRPAAPRLNDACPPRQTTLSPTTGQARPNRNRRRLGYDLVHAIIDDHSRFAYTKALANTKTNTTTDSMKQTLAAFAEQDIQPQRLISDNPCS